MRSPPPGPRSTTGACGPAAEPAGAAPPLGEPPPQVLRRARRRRWSSAVLAAVTASAVVAGSVIGIQAVLSDGRTLPIVQPTLPPTPSGPPVSGEVERAIWPAVDPSGRA